MVLNSGSATFSQPVKSSLLNVGEIRPFDSTSSAITMYTLGSGTYQTGKASMAVTENISYPNGLASIIVNSKQWNFRDDSQTDLPGAIRLYGSTSGSITLDPGVTPATQVYTLPAAYPTSNNQALVSTTGGVMSWGSPSFTVKTAAQWNAITGAVGQQVCVSDSGGGGNPDGMMAFWDTTHTRWSYIHDNSAV